MSLLEIEENDAFVFARCLMMSYAPTGNYAVDNGKLTFRDTQGRAYDFTFDLQDGNLIYRGEAIEDFLRDGDVFTYCGTDCPEQTATI